MIIIAAVLILAGIWRDGAEIPSAEYWEHWDSAPWQADCWHILRIHKETPETDY